MARHLIYKQKVTMNISRKEEAFAFQTRVSNLLQKELSDSLEKVLDHAFPPDRIVRIDSVKLDLGKINAQNFEPEFKKRFIEALTKNLAAKKEELDIAKDDGAVLSKAQSSVAALIFFLEKGYLPWYSSVAKTADWETQLLDSLSEKEYRYFLNWLQGNLNEHPVIAERLVAQFSDKFIGELLSKTAMPVKESWSDIFADYNFILNSIGDRNAADPRRKKKKTAGDSADPVSFRSKFTRSDVRNQIWRQAFGMLMRLKDTDLWLTILKELFTHFGIKNGDIAGFAGIIKKNSFKTNVVKHALENLVLLTMNEDDDTNITTDKPGRAKKAASGNEHDLGSVNTENIPAGDAETVQLKNKKTADGAGPHPDTGSDDARQIPGQNDTAGQPNTSEDVAGEHEVPAKNAAPAKPGNQKKHIPDTGEVISVNNSGIVILHPFLKRYFTDLNLLIDGEFVNNDCRARAVLLLNYLATGDVDAAEFDVTLQKILCGYPFEDTLPAAIVLTKKEKAESASLLNAVISHWEPLKNTSIAGLQGTFLQRNGNIETKEIGWLLKVEQKTVDVLLAKLPWGFSTIRLPWMQKMLSVDWY